MRLIAKPTDDSDPSKHASLTVTAPAGPPIPETRPLANPRWKEASMLRTARMSEAMRAHGKTMAVAAAAAGVLAGAGGASAALTSGPTPVTGHHSAVTTAGLIASKNQSKAVTPTVAFPIGHATPAPKASPSTAPAPAVAPQAAAVQQAAAPAPQPAPAQAAPAAAPAPQPAPQPATIYDSVTPSSIPAGAQAAVYSDGAYAASPSQVAGHPNTLWIDTNGSNPNANALDVEPGDATPQQAAAWVQQKLTGTPDQTAIVYTMRSEWQATKDAISALPPQMQSHVKWWIADPTGVNHVVPGSDATQWSWGQNYDITTANPGF